METKVCTTCKVDKPIIDFYPTKSKTRDGRLHQCKVCKVEETNAWRLANPEKFNESRRKRAIVKNYGISLDEYDEMLAKQNGVCAGCSAVGTEHLEKQNRVGSTRPLSVDHDHVTGKVRGLLCHQCNLVVGNSRDNPDVLRRLADYLDENGQKACW